jgi:hypothetical protein
MLGRHRNAMSNIPPDIYESVREFALAMTNASGAGDDALHDSVYQSFLSYYEEQTRLGRSHPFLTEALADYTDDLVTSARYYEFALEQARPYSDEPTHTKMISLAENLIELGLLERAEAYLRDGRAEAVRCADTFWIEDADRLLHELAP